MTDKHMIGRWRATVWDRPYHGPRFCVARKNRECFGGEEVATQDGGICVVTYATRAAAQAAARAMNGAAR